MGLLCFLMPCGVTWCMLSSSEAIAHPGFSEPWLVDVYQRFGTDRISRNDGKQL